VGLSLRPGALGGSTRPDDVAATGNGRPARAAGAGSLPVGARPG